MNFDQACAALEAAKIAEASATSARIDAERAVLALCPERDEGSVTERSASWKATVTYVVNRRVDEAALAAVRSKLAPDIFNLAFRFKPDISVSGIKHLRNNEPELYAIAAEAFTATPGKPSVHLERVERMKEAA